MGQSFFLILAKVSPLLNNQNHGKTKIIQNPITDKFQKAAIPPYNVLCAGAC